MPGGHGATIRRVPPGGHDGLPQHLAPLDHGSSAVAPGDADEAKVAVGPHVQHLDQV